MLSKVKKLYQAARDHAGFKRYFKNTSWLFGGQMFRMVLGLFVSVAVARYLKVSAPLRGHYGYKEFDFS
jgi:hypothetical protein